MGVIQEVGLPEVFYKAIELGIEPAIEVITAIPNAIGALCLNQVGQDQLAAQPATIPRLFMIFTSERHLKVLQEKENAVMIGSAIDELVRHHPTLTTTVFNGIQAMLQKAEEMGNSWAIPSAQSSFYLLQPTIAITSSKEDTPRMDAMDTSDVNVPALITPEPILAGEPIPTPEESRAVSRASFHSAVAPEETQAKPEAQENIIVAYIDVIGRVCSHPFSHLLSWPNSLRPVPRWALPAHSTRSRVCI